MDLLTQSWQRRSSGCRPSCVLENGLPSCSHSTQMAVGGNASALSTKHSCLLSPGLKSSCSASLHMYSSFTASCETSTAVSSSSSLSSTQSRLLTSCPPATRSSLLSRAAKAASRASTEARSKGARALPAAGKPSAAGSKASVRTGTRRAGHRGDAQSPHGGAPSTSVAPSTSSAARRKPRTVCGARPSRAGALQSELAPSCSQREPSLQLSTPARSSSADPTATHGCSAPSLDSATSACQHGPPSDLSIKRCRPPETTRASCAASRHSMWRNSPLPVTRHVPANLCGLRRCSSSKELRNKFTVWRSAPVRGSPSDRQIVLCQNLTARTSKSPRARLRQGAARATNLASRGMPAASSQSRALRPPSPLGSSVAPRRTTLRRPPVLWYSPPLATRKRFGLQATPRSHGLGTCTRVSAWLFQLTRTSSKPWPSRRGMYQLREHGCLGGRTAIRRVPCVHTKVSFPLKGPQIRQRNSKPSGMPELSWQAPASAPRKTSPS
mmetsp:Transcript_84191/g.238529  ORF Transcript_84191/g.238529 Transcript_84191/m.238529 type:complete len:497 (+) Transcript_84191:301-1791(+)